MADRTTQRLVVLALVPTAAAMAIALIVLRLHFQPPTIPPYVLTIGPRQATGTIPPRVQANDVDDRATRAAGDAGETTEWSLSASDEFELEARPDGRVEGAVAARAFLLRAAEVRAWDPPFAVSRDGVIRIRGSVRTLFAGVPVGRWEVAVAVGRPELLPTAPNDVLRARAREPGGRAGFRLLIAPVRLLGSGGQR
ncbi:MAG: hypothetical protein ABSC94_13885 [Polyangiaceae bacterium]|jgi:hypothetical protein